ncbi:glucan endo-1,3-beta-glucosidase 2-like isoform X1 [Typha latifolia]|uniref:glucan endo-1,3-beta-glucosidase 2-like isoform X1 n=1 Tax=Typha latifolia TaxID=4733 RepID=UPI003C2F1BC8
MFPKIWQGCIMLLILFLSSASGGLVGAMYDLNFVSLATTDTNSSNLVGVFCVAIASADSSILQESLNWACGPGSANCSAIQPGQPCYQDNNLVALTSYAYNDYYHKTEATGGTCNFSNTATITNTDPSYGSCIFAGSTLQGTSSGGGTNTTTGTGVNTTSSFGGAPNNDNFGGTFSSNGVSLRVLQIAYLVPVILHVFF